MGKHKKSSAKKLAAVITNTPSNAVSINLVIPASATAEERLLILFRQRMYALSAGLENQTPEQKSVVVNQAISLLEEFHRSSTKPDKGFYVLTFKLCMTFCQSTPDYYLRVPMLFKTVLDVLDRAKDTDLPEIVVIYSFAMTMIDAHISRNIQYLLKTGTAQEALLEVSFEDVFAIFQQFIANINYKKNGGFAAALQQQELDIYNKFIYILAITNLTNKLSLPELVDAWKAVSSRMLIKVFNQAEAANLSLNWTSYHHTAMSLSCTPNPNMAILWRCFDQLKALGFFEFAIAPNTPQTTVTAHALHHAFCHMFFQGLKQVLNYDHDHSTAHFTAQHLKKTLKVTAYLQAQGLLNIITPFIFDILARAPYHAKVDQSMKQFFQADYPYTPELFVSIFQGLSRSQSLDPSNVRFFFDYAVAHQLLKPGTQETKTILDHLFKALSKLSELQQSDIRSYFEMAITLQYDNLISFDRVMQALTKVTPAVDEETLLYFFNTIRAQPFFANTNEYNVNIVDKVLHCLEQIPAPYGSSLWPLLTHIEQCEQITSIIYFKIMRILKRNPALSRQLSNDLPKLYREYCAYQELYQIHATLQMDGNAEAYHEPFMSLMNASLLFSDTLISEAWDECYGPSEKLNQLQILRTELMRIQTLEVIAKQHDLRPDYYYQRVQNVFQASLPNINTVQTIVDEYAAVVESAQKRAQECSEQLSFETIWMYIKSKDIDKLEKANVCLDRLIANQAPAPHHDYLVAKINCLINLGKYDQANVWLGRAMTMCQDKNAKSLYISFAICCKKLGQFSAAISVRTQVHDDLHKANRSRLTPLKVVNLLELAHCHLLSEGYAHVQAALAIYADLKTQCTSLSKHNLLEIDVRIAECYIKLNQFSRAEQQLKGIAEGEHIPKVMLMFAWLYQIQQQFKQAKSIYLSLLTRKDNTEAIWRTLFRHCHRLPSKERALVRQHIHSLLETTGTVASMNNKTLLRERAMILIQEKRYQEALETLNHMWLLWGKDESIYIGLSICHRQLQNVDIAISMLTDVSNYSENRKIVMQLVECYQLKQDEQKLLMCFDLLLTRFQTYTLGASKAILYFYEHGHIEKMKHAWEHCRKYCKETKLLRDIEQLVQPYLSEEAPKTRLSEPESMQRDDILSEQEPVLDQTMIVQLEIEDVFYDPEVMFEVYRDESELSEVVKKRPRFVPNSFDQQTKPAISDTIKALDLAYPKKSMLFKDKNAEKKISDLDVSSDNGAFREYGSAR